jgi:SAM-dependent methyltransferase
MPTISAIGPTTVPFLLSPEGRAAAAALENTALDDAQLPHVLGDLRRHFDPDAAGALVTLVRLRRRAAAKFPHAAHLFFTAEALEQATTWEVAQQHAAWLDQCAPPGEVLDLGCGVGGDLLALAARRRVVAYELDPLRAAFARANAEAMGLSDQVEVRTRDWVQELHAGRLQGAAGAFADPARRVDERRVFRPQQMQPPLSVLLRLQKEIPVLGVKVMPGVADEDLPPECGVEFISHAGVCKEAVLWFGAARWRRRWATVVQGERAQRIAADEEPPPQGELAPGQVLYEPDGALIRAGCLGFLCRQLDAHLFDPQIAYLVGGAWRPHPLAQAFAVEEVHPFALKLLNRRLQELGVARVELKKRGFPVEPEALRPRLKLLRQGREATVIFTRRSGAGAEKEEHIMLIGRRLGSSA